MTTSTEIKRHADGSIDIPHYLARGRQARSDEAWHMAATLKSALGDRITRLLAAVKGKRPTPTPAKSPAGPTIPPHRAGRPRPAASNRARHAAERADLEIVS